MLKRTALLMLAALVLLCFAGCYSQAEQVYSAETLPPVDYSIPNEPMRGTDIVVYEDRLYMEDFAHDRIISCNLNGTDTKLLENRLDFGFGKLLESHGWLYYILSDGIYRIRPDGQSKTKLCALTDTEDGGYMVGPSMALGNTLYFVGLASMQDSFYRIDAKGAKRLFSGIGNYPTCFAIYENNVYYFTVNGVLLRYDLATGKNEKVLDYCGFCFSILFNKLYYFDKRNDLYVYDLETNTNVKLADTIDAGNINYSVQFHNYIIYFLNSKIWGYNIDTKKIYEIISGTSYPEGIYATNDKIYMMLQSGKIYTLSIADGKAKIEPLKALNEALKTLLWQ